MTTPTVSQIKARYPELDSTADEVVQLVIDDAVPWFDEVRWGTFYLQGFAAFVAHMIAMDKRAAAGGQAAAGPVQSKSVGDVSTAYASVQWKASDAMFATTPYGQKYLQLRRLVGLGALAV